MISRDECKQAARELRQVEGVLRVAFAQRDGIAHYDDAVLNERVTGAAAVSALMGSADVSAAAYGLGDTNGAVVYGAESQLIVKPVGADLVMVVVVDLAHAGTDVFLRVREVAERMEESGE